MYMELHQYDAGHIKAALLQSREQLQHLGSNSTIPQIDYALKLMALREPKFEPVPQSTLDEMARWGCD